MTEGPGAAAHEAPAMTSLPRLDDLAAIDGGFEEQAVPEEPAAPEPAPSPQQIRAAPEPVSPAPAQPGAPEAPATPLLSSKRISAKVRLLDPATRTPRAL